MIERRHSRRGRWAYAGLAVFAIALTASVGARAAEPEALVDAARHTVEALAADPDMASMRNLLKDAKGVLVIPQLLKAGFIIGGSGGSGVLLASGDSWSDPAFFTLGAGSIGFQFGGQASEVVLLLMTSRALDAVIHNQIKLGADLSVASGPVGRGMEAATTTNLGADIYSFARAKGLFAGVSFEGAFIKAREDWNRMFYGRPATARQIVILRQVTGVKADALKSALVAAASG